MLLKPHQGEQLLRQRAAARLLMESARHVERGVLRVRGAEKGKISRFDLCAGKFLGAVMK